MKRLWKRTEPQLLLRGRGGRNRLAPTLATHQCGVTYPNDVFQNRAGACAFGEAATHRRHAKIIHSPSCLAAQRRRQRRRQQHQHHQSHRLESQPLLTNPSSRPPPRHSRIAIHWAEPPRPVSPRRRRLRNSHVRQTSAPPQLHTVASTSINYLRPHATPVICRWTTDATSPSLFAPPKHLRRGLLSPCATRSDQPRLASLGYRSTPTSLQTLNTPRGMS